jgi:hypothetical protein
MSPRRLPRWTALLILPLLVGALLAMHGLDARATAGPIDGATAASTHPHDRDRPADHDDAHCTTCAAGHVMAACVAIVATVVGLRLAPRAVSPLLTPLIAAVTTGTRAAQQLARPPDPARVRLAVMLC